MKKSVSILCVVSLLIALVGCGASAQPDSVVSDYCKAVQTFDTEAMVMCMENADENVLDPEDEDYPEDVYNVLKENAKQITYTVGEPEVTEDTGIVSVEFNHLDLSSAATEAMGEYITQALGLAFSGADDETISKLFESILIEKIQNTEPGNATTTVKFSCVKTDDGWKIKDISDEFSNVITCNIAKGFEGIGEEGELDDKSSEEDIVWTDVAPGEEVSLATMKMKVTSCTEETSLKDDWHEITAKEGTKFVVFTVDVENISKDSIVIDGGDFPLYDNQDRTYNESDDASLLDGALSYCELAPNIPETGIIVYNVPSDCDGYYFAVQNADTGEGYCFLGK